MNHTPAALYCMTCTEDDLPTTFRCNRNGMPFIDNGPEAADEGMAQFEGICLRCCGHNHG